MAGCKGEGARGGEVRLIKWGYNAGENFKWRETEMGGELVVLEAVCFNKREQE